VKTVAVGGVAATFTPSFRSARLGNWELEVGN
jgi:hypothetical protein